MCVCAGFEHKITVQASPSVDKRKLQGSESTTPPASPGVIPRLRAIRRTYTLRFVSKLTFGGRLQWRDIWGVSRTKGTQIDVGFMSTDSALAVVITMFYLCIQLHCFPQ